MRGGRVSTSCVVLGRVNVKIAEIRPEKRPIWLRNAFFIQQRMAGHIGNALGTVDSLIASVMPGGGGDRPGERQLPKPYAEWDADKILWNRERVGKGCKKTMESGEATIYEVMQKAVATHGDRLTAGKRALIERHYDDQGRYVPILHRKLSCNPQHPCVDS